MVLTMVEHTSIQKKKIYKLPNDIIRGAYVFYNSSYQALPKVEMWNRLKQSADTTDSHTLIYRFLF